MLENGPRSQVDERSEWLHQVVGQGKGVAAVAVENADGRVQAGGHDRACAGSAKDGIAVVQEAIDVASVRVAPELRAEEERPIGAGGLRLDVGAVARLHATSHEIERCAWLADSEKRCRLRLDLGNDHPFPGLLAQGFGRGPLRPHAAALGVMTLQGQQHGAGLVVGGAQDDRCAALGQFD